MMRRPSERRVVVTQQFFDAEAAAYLRAHGCELQVAQLPPGKTDGTLARVDLLPLLDGAAGWIVGHAHVDRTLLAALPALQSIARRGVGYERIDTAAVAEAGRVATIAVGGNDACVADHTLALMLAVAHRLRESQLQMQAGSRAILVGGDLYRKTVGIVGLGRIGRAVVQRLRGFECRLLAHSPGTPALPGVAQVPLDELLQESDFITLHAPLTEATRHLVNAAAIARMKPSAIVVNTARGGLVHDGDLLAALKAERLAGAGLDVFASESDKAFEPVTAELVALPNVIASPHSGASTREGLARTNLIAAMNTVAVLDGHAPPPECVVADGRPGFAAATRFPSVH